MSYFVRNPICQFVFVSYITLPGQSVYLCFVEGEFPVFKKVQISQISNDDSYLSFMWSTSSWHSDGFRSKHNERFVFEWDTLGQCVLNIE